DGIRDRNVTGVQTCALPIFYGLVSDGGVHSHITHIYGLLELAKRNGLTKVFVHCFLDGRDTPPSSGKEFVAELEEKMKELGVGRWEERRVGRGGRWGGRRWA